ncbi:MAG: hypothetical protein ACKVON_09125 [Beijerinckiaceae bacterium]
MNYLKNFCLSVTAAAAILGFGHAAQAQGARVQVTGEIIDTFCSVSEVMFASGSAHYQCAVWCAVGGIPVSIKDKNGDVYMILRIEEDDTNVANPKLVTIQAHEVTVDGDLFKRDGVNYILVSKIATDKGLVTLTHDEHGIVPFGN